MLNSNQKSHTSRKKYPIVTWKRNVYRNSPGTFKKTLFQFRIGTRTLGVMNKLKHFLPTYTLRTMHNSLILPHLNFSILSWGLHSGRLPKLQKRAVRSITLNKYNAHTEPILKSLGLLKVNDIFTLQCLKFYFKCTHERVPTTFASFFTRNTARHDHNTRQRHQPEILFSHTSRARKCIKFYIPLLL